MLADLLHLVQTTSTPLTSGQLADRLGVEPAVVAGMLDWLSRSGRLQDDLTRPAKDDTCGSPECDVAGPCGACPFAALPETGRSFRAVSP